ncbi:hypothetical protein AAC03nite_25550 [Alicyclobacillus acidoterrestris]|uniref:CdaR family protein n=1 Tax=Alicyclobacillus suci TaxID=2816080 RepID=UPI0011948A21|nr:CdaR family protein [Alicyclobacillus suci]GEO26770.1 hypothetical protein AAC03nite_25550 [Alicyclobacillus acidoterrestris]
MLDRFLRNNLFLRIFALVLACIIWFVVHVLQDNSSAAQQSAAGVTQAYNLPIHVQVGDDMVVSSMSQSTATIDVTTSALNLPTLPTDMLKAELVVDAQGLAPGKQVLHIAAVDLPNDIKKYRVKPLTVTVVLEKKVSEAKPIDVEISGTPADGYGMGQLSLNTQSVTVSGARTRVAAVSRVVGHVDVSGMKATDTKIVNLTPVDSQGHTVQDVDISPSSISVNVPIQAANQKVALTPEVTGTPAPGYAVAGVKLQDTEVSESGIPAASLPKTGLTVPIDVSGLSKTSTVDVLVPLMQGMTQVTPSKVTAIVQVEPAATVTFQQVPVTLGRSGSAVTLPNQPTIDVTVTGPKSIVQGMTAKDVKVTVDTSNVKPGAKTAPVSVQVPRWVTVTDLSQRTVAVDTSQG